jgi:glyoxylase-like metal-dependent hydrolase (beta-lactamase superfamily II)/ferredoxin
MWYFRSMANINLKYTENIEGNFYVDSTCIDCGTCYWIAPDNFQRHEDHSITYKQPTKLQKTKAYQALYSCPTNSIGVMNKESVANEVIKELPFIINENVYHTGFHSRKSFGAASYFIKRDSGNIMIDSPRYLTKLSKSLRKLGGIKWQLLSHQDDVADTDLYHEDFNSTRLMHIADSKSKTSHFENLFNNNEPFQLDPEVTIIPVPGHTRGSVCYLYKNKYLFTGDHLAFSKKLNHLYAFKRACWFDFEIQINSMEKLLDFNFEYILPGHGAPMIGTNKEIKDSLIKCIKWMKN